MEANLQVLLFQRYFASNLGRLFSEKSGSILTPSVCDNRYVRYTLYKTRDKKGRKYSGHDIIMRTFIGPRPIGMVIDHIDRDKTNNELSNLEYKSQSDNIKNSERSKFAQGISVQQYDLDGNFRAVYKSISEASAMSGDSIDHINKCCDCRIKNTSQFIWTYNTGDLDGEIWVSTIISGVALTVSNRGRVKHDTNRITLGYHDESEYLRVVINSVDFYVHRVVCEVFHGPPPEVSMVVNHKDENRQNNDERNLEWLTTRENISHSLSKRIGKYSISTGELIVEYKNAVEASSDNNLSATTIRNAANGNTINQSGGYIWKYSEDRPTVGRKGRHVLKYKLDGSFVCEYDSLKSAAKSNGCGYSSISSCCSGKYKSSGGFIWKYKSGVQAL